MIYMRGQAADYDHWRQLGNAGWGWDDVLPYFMKSERSRRADRRACTAAAANGGSRSMRLSWRVLDLFREAAVEHGIPATDDFNRGDNEGVGYFEVNQRRGRRWSAATALPEAGAEAAEPDAVDRRAGAAAGRRGWPRHRRRGAPSRRDQDRCAPAARSSLPPVP